MKKRVLSIILASVMMMALLAGCVTAEIEEPDILPDDQIENPVDGDEDTDSDLDMDLDQDLEQDSNSDLDIPTDNNPDNNTDKNPDKKPDNNKGDTGNSKPGTDKSEPGYEGSAGSGALNGSLTGLVEKIYGITKIDQAIGIETGSVDLGNKDLTLYYLGLEDVSGVKEAVISEALMTAQAYSLALVRAKEGGDAEAIAKKIKKGIDPQKWICVIADDVSVVLYDDVILLVMTNSGLEDVATSKTIKSALDEISGLKGKIM